MRKIVLLKEIDYKTKDKVSIYGGWFEMYYSGFINAGYKIIKDN